MREDDLTNASRRKSSHSGDGAGSRVLVADGVPGVVPVRDGKVAGGPVPVAWTEFTGAVGEPPAGDRCRR